jgi:hypothetical protein
MAKKTNKNSVSKAQALENEEKALELRVLGYSYRKIGIAMGLSKVGAYKIVERAIAKQDKTITESSKRVMALDLARIDEVLPSVMERAKGGSDRAITSLIKLLDRQARYLGLDAAVKTEDLAEREKVILKLSERLDISIEEARAEYEKTKEGMSS